MLLAYFASLGTVASLFYPNNLRAASYMLRLTKRFIWKTMLRLRISWPDSQFVSRFFRRCIEHHGCVGGHGEHHEGSAQGGSAGVLGLRHGCSVRRNRHEPEGIECVGLGEQRWSAIAPVELDTCWCVAKQSRLPAGARALHLTRSQTRKCSRLADPRALIRSIAHSALNYTASYA